MGNLVKQQQNLGTAQPVRCPICAQPNAPMQHCRHVRWTFDQGDPIDFAHFAMETSPYTKARGFSVPSVPQFWWDTNVEWVVDQVMLHFEAVDGYVFGEVAHLDLLARDLWKSIYPESVRPEIARVDLF